MQVILLQKFQHLGELGDEVQVKPGYARNFLIPQGKAVASTAGNRDDFELRRAELVRQQAATLATAEARAQALLDVTVAVARRSGEGGRLFGSVGAADIAEAINAAGVAVHKNEVRLREGPIRQTGEHSVDIHLQVGVDATVTVVVEPEG